MNHLFKHITSQRLVRNSRPFLELPRRVHSRQFSATSAVSAVSSNVLLQKYQNLVQQHIIEEDPIQISALSCLDRLYSEIQERHYSPSGSAVSSTGTVVALPPKGIYLHGGVGCGKTFLMDFFYDHIPLQAESKQRVHFHEFMLNVHHQLHLLRQENKNKKNGISDPLKHVAKLILQKGWILCFDEFQVTDIADAMILKRLFTLLIEQGSIIIITSNRRPDDLYENGIQRASFLPFIHYIKDKCYIHSLEKSTTDYRKLRIMDENVKMFLYPLNQETKEMSNKLFQRKTKKVQEESVYADGREIHIPLGDSENGVCKFTFQQLCDTPLGAADYLAIGNKYHTIFLQDIPRLDLNDLNQVRRFITFIDCMYDLGVLVYFTADASIDELFNTSGGSGKDEIFSFSRTASRLHEMRSTDYINGIRNTILHTNVPTIPAVSKTMKTIKSFETTDDESEVQSKQKQKM